MKNNRPILKVPLQPLDIILELITVCLLILLFVFSFTEYSSLADSVPMHFDVSGQPDRYGDKSSIFLLPIIGLVLSIVMYVLSKYPHLHNYMVNITEENALKNYKFSARILRFTSLGIAILFCIIQYVIIQMGKGNDIALGNWFLPTIIVSSILTPIILFLYQYQLNKN